MRRPKGQQKNPARVFWGCWPSTLLSILCFLSFYKHTVFPLKSGYIVHFSVSPFLSPWFVSLFLFHSLSLSLYHVLVFSFLAFLFVFPSFFLLFFLALFFAFVSRKKSSNIAFERFLFMNYFCFLGFPVLPVFQSLFLFLFILFFQVCVLVNINVLIFQRRPFLKHPVLFCTLCKVIVFVKGRFFGASLVDVRKTL